MTNAPAADLLEKDFLNHVRQLAELLGWRVYHTWTSLHSPRGLPDLVMVRPPRLIFSELKRSKGKLTPPQEAWIEDLRRVEGAVEVYLWRPEHWFAGEIETVLR